MTRQQSCVPWTSGALDRVVAMYTMSMYVNVFAAAAGVLIGTMATPEA